MIANVFKKNYSILPFLVISEISFIFLILLYSKHIFIQKLPCI